MDLSGINELGEQNNYSQLLLETIGRPKRAQNDQKWPKRVKFETHTFCSHSSCKKQSEWYVLCTVAKVFVSTKFLMGNLIREKNFSCKFEQKTEKRVILSRF